MSQPQNDPTGQWKLPQVTAKCGVSNGSQLTDSFLHLIPCDLSLSNFFISNKSSAITSSAPPTPLSNSSLPCTCCPNQGNVHFPRPPLADFLSSSYDQSNGYSTNNSHLFDTSSNSLSGDKCFGNSGVSGVGVARIVGSIGVKSEDLPNCCLVPPVLRSFQQLSIFEFRKSSQCPLALDSTRDNLGGTSCSSNPFFSMVVPAQGQNSGNVTKSLNATAVPSKNLANSKNKLNNNNNTCNKNNNNNNSHKKNKNTSDDQQSYCCISKIKTPQKNLSNNSSSNKGNNKSNNHKNSHGVSSAQDSEEEVLPVGHPPSSKAVDAKEVKKLLENTILKGHQQQQKESNEGAESVNNGGCDTGYSSRCPTPPSPPTLAADQTSNPEDPKQGTKRHLEVPVKSSKGTQDDSRSSSSSGSSRTRESRSESPSGCSVSSQGSYRNPRPKRRYNHHYHHQGSDGYNGYYQGNNYHHNNHHYHQYQEHYPYRNYPHNHQGFGYGGNGNGPRIQYCNNLGPSPRDFANFYDRGYDRGYAHGNGYHQNYGNHYGREMNHYHGGDNGYGRYNNHGRGMYHNRYHNNNQKNLYNENFPPLEGGNSVRDQSQPVVQSDRAGTFSEKVSDNKPWKCEVVDMPKQLLTNSEWDGLSKQVWDMFCKHQQTNRTLMKKQKLQEKILKVIRNVLPSCRLFVVGSSLSGFGADWSDVDMCLMVTQGDLDQRTEATVVLRLLQRELNNCGFTQKMELIRAKVPILKFRDAQSHIDVDLNCNNAVGIRNTHLLHSYSQLDWRVRPLVLVVKLWAQHHNINNAKDMTISSYSLVLMVIHYLQHGVQPPVLPCLQKLFPQRFHDNVPTSNVPIMNISITEAMPTFTSNNHDTLGQLFHGFLNYFANTFTYVEDTISVRTGGTVPTSKCRNFRTRKNDFRMWKYLCIEEPFDRINTARSMYDEVVFERVKKVFADSYKLLDKKRDLSVIL